MEVVTLEQNKLIIRENSVEKEYNDKINEGDIVIECGDKVEM